MGIPVKLLKGSIVIDLSRLRLLGNRDLARLLRELVILSIRESNVLVSLAPFNANIRLKKGRVYRMSISHGAIIVSVKESSEDLKNICLDIEGGEDLFWQLAEDVWADVERISYKISLDPRYICPPEYVEVLRELGYTLSDSSESSRVICIGVGETISISFEDLGSRCLIIPITDVKEYKYYVINKEEGFRHPISVILGGRKVLCSEILDLELPEESRSIVKDFIGRSIIYSINTNTYMFSCTPQADELLYKITVFYTSLVRRL